MPPRGAARTCVTVRIEKEKTSHRAKGCKQSVTAHNGEADQAGIYEEAECATGSNHRIP